MQAVRRLYIYAVAYVSLITVLWGTIGLTRSIFAGGEIGDSASRLAEALSFILIGVPVFILHWWLAQRSALKDPVERSSRLRAIFLYGVLLTALIPIVQNTLALVSRTLLSAFGENPNGALLGGSQTLSDNLIAILLNGVIAAYFYFVLRADWKAVPQGDAFSEVRRLFRYLVMLYGLAMVVFGAQQVLQYILGLWGAIGMGQFVLLANGLALLLVGTPLWIFTWSQLQRSLIEEAERRSLLRLVVLYGLTFISVGSVLVSMGIVGYILLRFVLGEPMSVESFLGEISTPLSVAITFGVVWAYYGRLLRSEMEGAPGQGKQPDEESVRRAGLRRLYYYTLAFFGLGAMFIGLQLLLAYIIDITLSESAIWGDAMRDNLAAALSTLAVGIPLWVFTWRPVMKEATAEGEAGDHARRSLVRRVYLYLVLFIGVMGVMFSSGGLLFQIISALLGDPSEDLLVEVVQLFKVLILFLVFLAYHWQVLRVDNRLAGQTLASRHAQFPVLILAPDEGDFGESMVNALEREMGQLPVALHLYSQGAPDETLSAAKAVIFPAELAAMPSEALRLWLQGFSGERLVVPTMAKGWYWIFGSGRPLTSMSRQTARVIRYMAEGEDIPKPRETSPWMVIAYIVAGLIALQVVGSLIDRIASLAD
jgi:hypothetical protein